MSSLMHTWAPALLRGVARRLFRVRVLGTENLPKSGGAVVIANHISRLDFMLLRLACTRPLRLLFGEETDAPGPVAWLTKGSGAIEVSNSNRMQWVREAVKALEDGQLVCVFPEGSVSPSGSLMPLRNGFEYLARRAQVPVIPVGIDCDRDAPPRSRYDHSWNFPRGLPKPFCIAFGEPIPCGKADRAAARTALLRLSSRAYFERPHLGGNLARETVPHLQATRLGGDRGSWAWAH